MIKIKNKLGIKCIFERCKNEPKWIVYVEQGCICHKDKIQSLCHQHYIKAENQSDMVAIIEFKYA